MQKRNIKIFEVTKCVDNNCILSYYINTTIVKKYTAL